MGALVIWLGLTGESAYRPELLQGAYLWLRQIFDALTQHLGAFGPLAVVVLALLVVLLIVRMPRRSAPGA